MSAEPFALSLPARRLSPAVFSSPHSGSVYPDSFLRHSALDERTIRSSEDAFVDRLFAAAPRFGAPLLAASMPRAFVDLNRNADELDPALIEDVAGSTNNPRISSGLGVVPRVVANGQRIYGGRIARADAEARLASHWRPYHDTLRRLLDESLTLFGEAVLIDCHSMPHDAIEQAAGRPGAKPEVVLGDRFGAAAGPAVIDRVEAAFTAAGLRVARNTPFAGAFITQHYGRPSHGQHAVQVEIDRGLYMDEDTIRPSGDFEAFRQLLVGVIAEIAGAADSHPLAAE